MAQDYNHKDIEPKWQQKWAADGTYKTVEGGKKEKAYVLDMFPYPSGEGLHVGHPKGYIATDVYSRMQRMLGKSVLHPMGWDAFGLPAENYAIKTKTHPRKAVEKNVARYKDQLSKIGFDYDWSREINTTDPAYYKWTQWIFLKLLGKGLAYETTAPINWCPSCQTGLANEDVEADGTCERCGTKVEKRPMRQWVLKITDYADRLLNDLSLLPKWPEHIKEQQRNWIGRSEGAEIDFAITGKYRFVLLHGFKAHPEEDTYAWIKKTLESQGHEVIVPELPNPTDPTEDEWVETALNATEYDSRTILIGHSLGAVTAMKVVEKLNKKIAGLILCGGFSDPNFIDHPRPFTDKFAWKFDAEKIRSHAGRIVILHDKNDHIISPRQAGALSQLLSTPITEVEANESHFGASEEPEIIRAATPAIRVFTTRVDTLFGVTFLVLAPESPFLPGLSIENTKEVAAYIAKTADKSEIDRAAAKEKTGIELKGVKAINPATKEEIPVFVADYVLGGYGTGAIMAVPDIDERDGEFATAMGAKVIETKLVPFDEALKVSGGRTKVQYRLQDWVFSRQRYWGEPIPVVHCQKDGTVPVSEKDLPVMLPEVEHYEPTGTGESPLAAIADWVNTTCPKCGGPAKRETNTMPQWAGSSWYHLRFMDPHNDAALVDSKKEKYWDPVDLYVGGAEHATRHLIYARFWHKFLLDIGVVHTEEPFMELHSVGLVLADDGRKMSKRYGNVINPDDIVATFGADSLRVYEMFMGPFGNAIAWSTDGLVGARRFVERVWRLADKAGSEMPALDSELHKTIEKVSSDIAGFKFNTAISQMMICINAAEKGGVGKMQFETFLKLLAPFAPHLTEELWHQMGHDTSIHLESWPTYDASKTVSETVSIAIQVAGKTRGTIEATRGVSEGEVMALAKKDEKLAKYLDFEPKKTIFVQDRILNLVP